MTAYFENDLEPFNNGMQKYYQVPSKRHDLSLRPKFIEKYKRSKISYK